MTRDSRSIEDQLARIPLFAGLDRRHLREVSQLSTRIEVPEGRVLVGSSERGQLVIVVDGAVEVRRDDTVVATGGPGMFVGEIGLLTDRPPTATVRTTAPSVVEVVDHREFQTLLSDMPELRERLLATMSTRLAELEALDPVES
jgi:CRP-like cAMP-binding protein